MGISWNFDPNGQLATSFGVIISSVKAKSQLSDNYPLGYFVVFKKLILIILYSSCA